MIRVTVNNRGVQAIPLSPVTVGAEGIVAAFLFSDDWAGLAKTAIFKGSGEEVEKIVLNNECTVPPEVLAEAGGMLQVGVYGNDGHGTTIRPTIWGVVGRIEDGAISEDAGQTGTTPSWAAQLQNAVQEAITTANNAVIAAEENADDSEAWAVGTRDGEAIPETDPAYQNYAKYWAERAAASATEGAESAATASGKANEAAASAGTASNKAGEAATSAGNAAASAEAANTAKTAAQNAQTAAEQAKAGAETARDASSSSAGQAAESATQAAGSASDAAQSATAAQGSESAAATSAQNAAASEAAAATSARNAGNSATAAATSETNAANSATAAAGSAGNAATSEQNASASATAAANSVTAAQTAQSAAEDAQDAAETAAASVSSSAAQITQNASDISELTRQLSDETTGLDTKAPVILETASGAIASFDDGADGMPVKKLVAQIEPVQEGTGDPSPDNVRPISGWTGAEIEQAGINIWDEEWDRGYIDEGEFTQYPAYVRSKHKFRIDGGKTYYFACSRSGTLGNTGITFYDTNGDFISLIVIPVNIAFTAPAKAEMMAFFVPPSWYIGDYANDISINCPATDTEYHPYTGNQISVTFPETIYGGEDEVISGKLMDTKFVHAFDGTEDITKVQMPEGNTGKVYQYAPFVPDKYGRLSLQDKISSAYPYEIIVNIADQSNYTWIIAGVNGVLRIRDDRFGTLEQFKAYLAEMYAAGTPVVVGFDRANPIEYTVESQELNTLYGTNNIWSSTGDTSVEYCADTKLYIDNKITQAIANALNS